MASNICQRIQAIAMVTFNYIIIIRKSNIRTMQPRFSRLPCTSNYVIVYYIVGEVQVNQLACFQQGGLQYNLESRLHKITSCINRRWYPLPNQPCIYSCRRNRVDISLRVYGAMQTCNMLESRQLAFKRDHFCSLNVYQ